MRKIILLIIALLFLPLAYTFDYSETRADYKYNGSVYLTDMLNGATVGLDGSTITADDNPTEHGWSLKSGFTCPDEGSNGVCEYETNGSDMTIRLYSASGDNVGFEFNPPDNSSFDGSIEWAFWDNAVDTDHERWFVVGWSDVANDHFGVDTVYAANDNQYIYDYQNNCDENTIIRTVGWHQFKLEFYADYVLAYINDTLCHNYTTSVGLQDISFALQGEGGHNTHYRLKDIVFYEGHTRPTAATQNATDIFVVNQSYNGFAINFTSEGEQSCGYNASAYQNCGVSNDLTPTFSFVTVADATCKLSLTADNYTTLDDAGISDCATTGTTTHTCTQGSDVGLDSTTHTFYASCQSGSHEMNSFVYANYWTYELNISITEAGNANCTAFLEIQNFSTTQIGFNYSVCCLNPTETVTYPNVTIDPASMFSPASTQVSIAAKEKKCVSFYNTSDRDSFDQSIFTISGATITQNITTTTNDVDAFVPMDSRKIEGYAIQELDVVNYTNNGITFNLTVSLYNPTYYNFTEVNITPDVDYGSKTTVHVDARSIRNVSFVRSLARPSLDSWENVTAAFIEGNISMYTNNITMILPMSKQVIGGYAVQFIEVTNFTNYGITFNLTVSIVNPSDYNYTHINITPDSDYSSKTTFHVDANSIRNFTYTRSRARGTSDAWENISAALLEGNISMYTNAITMILPVDPPSKQAAAEEEDETQSPSSPIFSDSPIEEIIEIGINETIGIPLIKEIFLSAIQKPKTFISDWKDQPQRWKIMSIIIGAAISILLFVNIWVVAKMIKERKKKPKYELPEEEIF